MSDRMIVAVLLGALLTGCVGAKIRAEASELLQCPQGQLTLEEKNPDTFYVQGCGKAAVCQAPKGGEVQCIGGASSGAEP
jgi:hypothetical protein